jgi:hypothetical protein
MKNYLERLEPSYSSSSPSPPGSPKVQLPARTVDEDETLQLIHHAGVKSQLIELGYPEDVSDAVVEAFVRDLRQAYQHQYGTQPASPPSPPKPMSRKGSPSLVDRIQKMDLSHLKQKVASQKSSLQSFSTSFQRPTSAMSHEVCSSCGGLDDDLDVSLRGAHVCKESSAIESRPTSSSSRGMPLKHHRPPCKLYGPY